MQNGDLKVTVRVELDDAGFASQIQSLLSQYENLEIKIKAPQIEGSGKQVDEQKGKWQQWKETMEKTSEKVVEFGQTATKEGSKLSNAFKPVVNFGKDCVETAAEVDYLQTQIAAISGVDKSNKAYTTLQQTITDIAKSSQYTGAEVSETALVFTKAGFSLDQTNKMLEATKNGALASGVDMQKMATGVGNAIRSFNLDAEDSTRVIDVLSKTANMSNTDLGSMISTLSNCSATAGGLGLDITQVSSALGTMANGGIQAGKASTQLRNIMLTLSDGAVKYNDGLHDINVSTVDSQGNFRDLTDIFGDLSVQCADMTDAQKVAFAETLVGKTNVEGFLTLLNNSDSLSNFNTELQNCEGTAKDFADAMGDTTKNKMKIFGSQVENLKTTVGDKLKPAFEDILDVVGKFCDLLSNDAVAKVISLAIEFGTLVVAIGTGIKVFGLITTAIGLLCSPIGLVVTAIAILGVAIYEVCKHWDFLKEVAGNCWNAIKDWFGNIGEWFSEKWQGVKDATSEAWEKVKSTTSEAWQNVKDTVNEKVEVVKEAVEKGWNYMKDNVIAPVNQGIQQLIEGDWEGFKTTISTAVEKIKGDISEKFEGAKEAVKNAMEGIKTEIEQKFNNAKESAKNAVTNLKETVSKKFEEMKQSATNAVTNLKESVSKKFEEAKTSVTNAVNGIKDSISKKFEEAKTSATNAVNNLKTSVSTAFQNLKSIIGTVVSGIVGDIKTSVSKWATEMKNGAERAISSCVSAFSGLGQKIMGAVSGVASTISGWWQGIKSIFSGGISASVNITKHVKEGSLSPSDVMTLDNEFTTLDSSNNILTNSGVSLGSLGVNTNNIKALDKQTVLLQEISDKLDAPMQVNTTVNAEVKNDVDVDSLVKKIEAHQRRAVRRTGTRLGMSY